LSAQSWPAHWRFGLAALAASGAALAALGSAPALPVAEESTALAIPAAQVVSIDDEDRGVFREERIQRGDTLASLLARLGVDDADALKYLRATREGHAFSGNLRPGRNVRAETSPDGDLVSLSYALSPTEVVRVTRQKQGFSTTRAEMQLERRVHMRGAEIRHSLFGAADAVGLPDSVTMQVAEIFGGDIDFHKDIRRGDRLRVVYEMLYHEGEFLRAGRVLAVEFVNQGKAFAAVWYEAPGTRDEGGYYTPEGKNLRRAFLRSPLEFSRISSGFGARMHPIFQTWKEHRGVDYAAPSGTRVRSVADGVVEFAGRQGGYGNVVVVRHQNQYSTLYAHLSAFGPQAKKGARLAQGETVGFVGQTGWATGPHLHYEFRVATQPVNPLTIALPHSEPLADRLLADFHVRSQPALMRIAAMRGVAQTAALD
jgi:murein DD-endopeptidase MepM/ murein hydrolase activator NlpD